MSTVEATPNTGMSVLKQAGIVIPTADDIAARQDKIFEKQNALVALLSDDSLPEATRAKVRNLVDQSRPEKPGMEEVLTGWTIPRVQIVQPVTQTSARPESAKAGDMFTTSGNLVDRPFGIIPLWFHEENVAFPKGAKVPECSAPDAKLGSPYGLCKACRHLPFGKQNGGRGDQKPTMCQNQIVVTVLSADLSQVYSIQFAKTSRGAGAALISLAKPQPFPWKQSYLLSTEKQTGELGVYYRYKTEATGRDNTPDAIAVAKALSELFEATRKMKLAEWYMSTAVAPQTASVVDQQFTGAMLDLEGGEEPDLSVSPVVSNVRSSGKPM